MGGKTRENNLMMWKLRVVTWWQEVLRRSLLIANTVVIFRNWTAWRIVFLSPWAQLWVQSHTTNSAQPYSWGCKQNSRTFQLCHVQGEITLDNGEGNRHSQMRQCTWNCFEVPQETAVSSLFPRFLTEGQPTVIRPCLARYLTYSSYAVNASWINCGR